MSASESPTPPYSQDAEESVLGCLLESKSAIATVSAILDPEDFFVPAHQTIYEAVMALFRRGDPVDAITVAEELTRQGSIERVGGKLRLAELLGAYGSASSAPFYARIVAENAQLRSLVDVGNRVMQIGYEHSEDVTGAVAEAEKLLYQAIQGRKTSARSVNLAAYAPAALADLEKDAQIIEKARAEGRDVNLGFNLGLKKVDRTTGGFQEGQYILFGASSSLGKTSLMIQGNTSAARAGRRVVHFSLEMPLKQVLHRYWAQTSDVPVHHLTNPALLDDKGWTSLIDSSANIPGEIWVADGSFSIDEILAEVRRLQVEKGGVDVVAIDYIQLVGRSRGKKFGRREEEISDMSRALKALANETGITVMVAAQLNREFEKEKRRPTLRDLRESGSLGHDPDIVMLLHRPVPKKDDGPQMESLKPTEFIIAKHRSGPTGLEDVIFDAPRNLFVDAQ